MTAKRHDTLRNLLGLPVEQNQSIPANAKAIWLLCRCMHLAA